MPEQSWRSAKKEPLLSALFARELGINEITAQLLVNRGAWSLEEAAAFLAGDAGALPSPWTLKDMDKAVARLKQAVEKREHVLIYGDYDADGVTATALLFLALQKLGVQAKWHLPTREEGYGLKTAVLEELHAEGIGVVVTADCGISGVEEALWCRENGIDLVITDHHQPGPELPEAAAVVNPKRADCRYPYKELAGVGVAYKLAEALLEGTTAGAEDLLDLVAIGTIADVVPLTGENRTLVRAGLEKINQAPRPGIAAILGAAGQEHPVTCRTIAMFLAPRVNAAGRLGNPDTALDLLLCGGEIAEERANVLESINQERKRLEALMSAEAQAIVDGSGEGMDKPVLVVVGEGWLPGLTGLAANRLVERYGRPVFLVAMNGSQGRGSGRGTPGFDVYRALQYAAPHLLEYGGHTGAGGFSVKKEAVSALNRALVEYAAGLGAADPGALVLDAAVALSDLTPRLMDELELLEPHGCGNPPPLLTACGLEVEQARTVGQNGRHLKLRLRQGSTVRDAIGFGLAGEHLPPQVVDVAFRPVTSELTGRVELRIEYLRGTGPAVDGLKNQVYKDHAFNRSLEFVNRLTDIYYPEEVPEASKTFSAGTRKALVDLRGYPDRWHVLQELARRRSLAVVVSTAAGACEAAARLRLAFGAQEGDVRVYHSGITGGPGMCEPPETGITVVTPAFAGVFPGGTDIVIFDLLHTWPQWEWLRACGGENVYLLFGSRERDVTRRRLRGFAPPRKALAELYRYLMRQADRGVVEVEPRILVGVIKSAGIPGAGLWSVENALKVLSELGLISYASGQDRFRIELQAQKGKRFLPSAPTFKRQHSLKREMLSCQKHFLIAAAEELKDFFRCGIISPGGIHGGL
jgi:single-stranded-DNA-specific exonuclease